jgi:endonuclease/exonuclease/phosphatase family metal-dependent hydrolase
MRIVTDLSPVPPNVMARAARPGAPEPHGALAREALVLDEIEVRPARPAAAAPQGPVRIAAWNLERCKHIEPSAALLTRTGASLALLSEMDLGMAGSGDRHTTRDLAAAWSAEAGYAFATEFVEIGLGNQTESIVLAGQANARGLHGNAIVSRLPFRDVAVIPLEDHGGGSWWDLDWHHRRIGGRMAVAATLDLHGQPVRVVSAHLESLPGPERREAQARRIVADLERTVGRDGAALIGGDINAVTLPPGTEATERPDWFVAPEAYEGAFRVLREAGFTWMTANTPEPTRRQLPNGWPVPPFNRLDWFFVRGLKVSNPGVWPAVGEEGTSLSDHELVTLDVEPD